MGLKPQAADGQERHRQGRTSGSPIKSPGFVMTSPCSTSCFHLCRDVPSVPPLSNLVPRDYFDFHTTAARPYSQRFVELFGPPRGPLEPIDLETANRRRFANIAASVQRVLEEVLVDICRALQRETGARRGYLEFIDLTYLGAYGRDASCFELRVEYTRLVNAAAGGTLNAEARRFVATRFMTQTSYNDSDLSDYVQTTQYEAINPAANGDRTSLTSFIADLYRAFLQREPDAGGQCFWTNNTCSEGRKHAIRAFEESIEFGNVVAGLYDSGAPSCGPGPGDGDPCLRGRPGDIQPICPV